MLSHREHVEPHRVRELCRRDDLGVACCHRDRLAGMRIGSDVGEGIEPDFHVASRSNISRHCAKRVANVKASRPEPDAAAAA